jgi:hypothetical protein
MQMFKKIISKVREFIARLFLRQAIKHSMCCACCKNKAIKIVIDTPFHIAVCEDHITLGNEEVKRARVQEYMKLGCTKDKATQLAG